MGSSPKLFTITISLLFAILSLCSAWNTIQSDLARTYYQPKGPGPHPRQGESLFYTTPISVPNVDGDASIPHPSPLINKDYIAVQQVFGVDVWKKVNNNYAFQASIASNRLALVCFSPEGDTYSYLTMNKMLGVNPFLELKVTVRSGDKNMENKATASWNDTWTQLSLHCLENDLVFSSFGYSTFWFEPNNNTVTEAKDLISDSWITKRRYPVIIPDSDREGNFLFATVFADNTTEDTMGIESVQGGSNSVERTFHQDLEVENSRNETEMMYHPVAEEFIILQGDEGSMFVQQSDDLVFMGSVPKWSVQMAASHDEARELGLYIRSSDMVSGWSRSELVMLQLWNFSVNALSNLAVVNATAANNGKYEEHIYFIGYPRGGNQNERYLYCLNKEGDLMIQVKTPCLSDVAVYGDKLVCTSYSADNKFINVHVFSSGIPVPPEDEGSSRAWVAPVAVILTIVGVIVIGVVVYYVWKNNQVDRI